PEEVAAAVELARGTHIRERRQMLARLCGAPEQATNLAEGNAEGVRTASLSLSPEHKREVAPSRARRQRRGRLAILAVAAALLIGLSVQTIRWRAASRARAASKISTAAQFGPGAVAPAPTPRAPPPTASQAAPHAAAQVAPPTPAVEPAPAGSPSERRVSAAPASGRKGQ